MNTTASRTRERRVSVSAVLRFAAGNVALGALAFLGSLATFATVGSLLYRSAPVVTVSDSMSPAINTGDLLITRSPDGPPTPGSILVFRDASGQGLVTHRLEWARKDDLYVTRGDANPKPDSYLVPADDVVGVGALVIPLVGTPVAWYSNHGPATLLASGGGLLVTLLLAGGALRPAWDPWAQPAPSPTTPARRAPRPWPRRLISPRHASLIIVATIGLGSICQSSAAFADTTATANNAVNAAQYFPCTSFPTYTALSGFEYAAGGATSTFYDTIGFGTGSVISNQSTFVRSGNWAAYLTTTSSGQTWIGTNHSGSTYIGRIGIRLNNRPTSNVTLISAVTGSGSDALFGYNTTSQRFTMGWSGATAQESTAIMQTGQWHLIEYRIHVGANPRTIEWRIDGVAQTTTSLAQTASTISSHRLGSATASHAYTMYFDDLAASATWADYPIGDGRVLALNPNSTAVVGGATFREDGFGSTVGSSSWQKILVPDYSTYIRQTSNSTTSYVQIGFENTPVACVRGVVGYIVYSASSSVSNNAKASIMVGSTERTIRQGTFNGDPIWHRTLIAPASSNWTPDALNTATGRFGFSSNTSPEPRLNAMFIEYETR